MAAGPVARSRAQIPLRLCFFFFLSLLLDFGSYYDHHVSKNDRDMRNDEF